VIPRQASIRRKLKAISMIAGGTALLIACTVFIVYDFFSYRRLISLRLEILAEIAGSQSTAALAFNDAKVAAEVLGYLSAEPSILEARIYTKDGKPFAHYTRPGTDSHLMPARPGPMGTFFNSGRVDVFHPIQSEKDVVGTIFLRSDLEDLGNRLILNSVVLGVVLILSLWAAYVLTSRLEGRITRPILSLVETVKAVSDRKDYAIRASGGGPDETGLLIDGFNEMLGQIQARDAQLETARQNLEKRVEERTRQLRIKEAELLQSQKMEAIGRLAGGVAHDFNNMLTAILGFSDISLQDDSLDERTRVHLEEIRKAGKRAKALTAQLLAFSRRQVLQPEVLDLNALLVDMRGMLQRLVGQNIRLEAELDPQIGCVRADPIQMQQVVMNLVLNARDAMPGGGEMILRTAQVLVQAPLSWRDETVPPGSYSTLSAVDTGPGLPPEALEHLFEPFFTTKPRGQGTGLGLSTVYGIVKQSNGFVLVESAPGRGTTFTIYLPTASGAPKPPPPEGTEERPAIGPGTALLAEDEPVVRRLAGELLRRQGFRVVEAADGEEALKAFEPSPHDFSIVVTDVMMPVLGGRELAERLRRVRPSLPILFMSGYTDDTAVRNGVMDQQVFFLQKPFSPARFMAKVRETMEARSPSSIRTKVDTNDTDIQIPVL
jgi:signal transduction histidine kinase/CheY-like chemotaxis protein